MISRLTTFALVVSFAAPAAAQDKCTWIGPSGDWETAEHWSCGHVPTPADTAVVSNDQEVTLNTDVELAAFEFAGSTTTLLGAGNLSVTDRMTWDGGNWGPGTRLIGTGAITIQNGATLRIQGADRLQKTLHRTIDNFGTVTWKSDHIEGAVHPDGFQEIIGTFINRSGGTFTVVPVGIEMPRLRTNFHNEAGAVLDIDTERAIFGEAASSGTQPDEPSHTEFTNDGVVIVRSGLMEVSGTFANTGTVTAMNGSELHLDDHLTNTGTITLEGADLSIPLHYADLGGVIEGSGVIRTGAFYNYPDDLHTNTATWSPGPSTAVLSLDGSFLLDREGRLEIEVGGTLPGEYDQLAVRRFRQSDWVTFEGTLDVSTTSGFVPQSGDRFPIITSPGHPRAIFRRVDGLVDTANDLVLWPEFARDTLALVAYAGVPVMNPEITLSISSTTQRGSPLVLFAYGEGFAPDVTVRLVCRSCNDPVSFDEVDGPFRTLSPTQIGVWFDFSDPLLWGEYDFVIEDPRGGRAVAPFTILPGQMAVSVEPITSDVQEGQSKRAFLLRTNQPVDEPFDVEYEWAGSATYWGDYLIDAPQGHAHLRAGTREAYITVLALPDATDEGAETLTLTLEEDDDYIIMGTGEAEVAITDGPAPDAFAVIATTPKRGGNGGPVTIRIAGQGFAEGAVARLVRGGDEITGTLPVVNENGTVLHTIFDLEGRAEGLWDIVVDNGAGETAVAPDAFSIEPPQIVRLTTQLTGPSHFRASGPLQPHVATIINRGNQDAYLVPVWIRVSKLNGSGGRADQIAALDLSFDVEHIEGWEDAPVMMNMEDEIVASVILPVVPAGSSVSLPFRARAYNVSAWTTRPLVDGIPDAEAVEALARKMMTSMGSTAVGTPLGQCVMAILQTVVDVIPISDCVTSIMRLTGQIMNSVISAGNSAQSGSSVGMALSGAGMMSALLGTGLSCVGSAVPAVAVIQMAVDAIIGVGSIVSSCSGLWADDPDPTSTAPRNPFDRPDPAEVEADEISAKDPNDKLGPAGANEGHFVVGTDPFGYLIRFENDPEATAAALEVLITDQLDVTKFDLSTFSLGAITFGERTVVPPPGLKTWSTSVDLVEENLRVHIFAALDDTTGGVLWRFATVDLETGELPQDPFAGFLPPNVTAPEGEGSVFFTIEPRAGLGTGDEIRNAASIIFDTNEPIDTPDWVNSIDGTPPSSNVHPLADVQGDSSFTVRWSGSDIGAGVSRYSIFVSRDGGPYAAWLSLTTDTSATFKADSSSSFAFYSIAHDAVGHTEIAPESPDAVTDLAVSTEAASNLPTVFALQPNYPNPFNPQTTIRYDVPRAAHVRLAIYDALGRQISLLIDGEVPAGRHSVVWAPSGIATGVYFYRMQSQDFDRVGKMLLIQ